MKTDRFARVALAVVLGGSLAGCGGGSDSTKPQSVTSGGGTSGGTQGAAPLVVQTIPADQSSGAPTDGMVEVIFSQSIDPSTITSSTIGILDSSNSQVAASLAYDDSVMGVTIAPQTSLTAGASYSIVVAPGLKDTAGIDIGQTVQLSFTTGTGPDQAAPTFAGIASATPDGQGGVTLSWQPATDPKYASNQLYYTIYQGASAATVDFTKYIALVPFGDTTPHLNLGLAAGQTTFLVARSWNLANRTDGNSLVVSVTGPQAARTAPTFGGASGAAAQSSSSIAVNWSAASDAFDPAGSIVYKVFQGATAGNVNLSTPVATVTGQTSATVTGLSASTTYFFIVRSYNTAGLSENSTKSVSATTPAATVTRTAPTFAGASSAAAQSANSIQVSWAAAHDTFDAASAIIYKIYAGTTAANINTTTPAFTTTAGATSAVVGGAAPSTTYFFIVHAVNTAGLVDTNTKVVSATTPAATVTRTAPTFAGASSASALSSTSLQVSWAAASDTFDPASAIVYKVYAGTTAANINLTTPVTQVTGALTATITGATASTTYFFRVHAVNTAGLVDTNTKNVSATTQAAARTAPTFAGASSAAAQSASAILVSWPTASDTVDPAASLVYKVYRGTTAANVSFASPVAQVTGGTSASITGLTASTAYFFVVRATNTVGLTDTNTKVVSATTQAAAATGPSFATAIEQGIFQAEGCTGCHPGNGGFDARTYASVIKGGNSGTGIVPFKTAQSFIYNWLSWTGHSGTATTNRSNHTITAAEGTNLTNWINAGALNN